MKKILIIGATSAIANSCARIWAVEKAEFFLVARDQNKLQQVAADLVARGAVLVKTHAIDLNKFDAHQEAIEASFNALGKIDVALIAHGTLPDQKKCEENVEVALQEFSSNGLSVIAILTLLANKMEKQNFGTIAVISSVAGDRGRGSNYLYGSAKAAVTAFCEGLRARMFKVGVHVLTIKPGFVNTPMTKDLSLPQLLVAAPEKVAQDICKAIEKKSDSIYTPFFWWGIMTIIKAIPTAIFKKLKL
jgi:decaprenylphospho-beta-D-erythro-pentofuranosid-2-ulose 2-reductase